MSARTLRISATGFDKGEATFIRTTVELASGIEIGSWEFVDDASSADLLLLNTDSDAGQAAQQRHSKDGVGPCTVACAGSQTNQFGTQPSLHRPVVYPALIQLLRGMQVELPKRRQSAARQGVPAESVVVAAANESTVVQQVASEPVLTSPKSAKPVETSTEVSEESPPKPKAKASEVSPVSARQKVASAETESVAAAVKPAETAHSSQSAAEHDADLVPELETTAADVMGSKATGQPASEVKSSQPTRPDAKAGKTKASDSDSSAKPVEAGNADETKAGDAVLANGIPAASIMTTKRTSRSRKRKDRVSPVDKAVAKARRRLSEERGLDGVSSEAASGPVSKDRDRPARRFFDATRFLGLVKQAIAAGRPVEIVHREFPTVRVVPDRRSYSLPSNVDLDPEMFRVSSSEFEMHDLDREGAAEASQWSSFPLWQLLYVSALYGSEGRLFDGAHAADSLRLTVEPDYDLVPYTEEHKTVARFLLTESTDAETIASRTGVNLSAVIDFCNACEEVLLLERVPAQVEGRVAGSDLAADNPFAERLRKSLDSKPKKGLLEKAKSILLGTW